MKNVSLKSPIDEEYLETVHIGLLKDFKWEGVTRRNLPTMLNKVSYLPTLTRHDRCDNAIYRTSTYCRLLQTVGKWGCHTPYTHSLTIHYHAS